MGVRRTGLVLALAGTLGVGLIAFPASAAAAPPVVPSCTPKATSPQGTFSRSCARLAVNAPAPPIGAQFENVRLGFRTRSTFSSSSAEVQTLTLNFDDDIEINLAGIPVCPASELSGDIAQAWEQCGPGADGFPASEGNAYLSTGLGNNVSGIASTVNPMFEIVCTMIFKGGNNNRLTIWMSPPGDPTPPSTACDNPASNTSTGGTIVLTGYLTRQPAASPYGWRLAIPNFSAPFSTVDDFYATLVRGAAFRARCPAGQSPHKLEAVFDYTGTEPTDTISPPYGGTQDPCP